MPSHITVGVLLAAGSGQRFDPTGASNKLTRPLANGVPIAVQAALTMRSELTRVVAVVRDPELASQLRASGCDAYVFPDALQGMGASLAYAMHFVHSAHAVMVGLADMPFIAASTIAQITQALSAGADIVQPYFEGQPGHPVGFTQRHFNALMGLSGDVGARELLRQFPVHRIAVDDAGIVRDIDFLTDL